MGQERIGKMISFINRYNQKHLTSSFQPYPLEACQYGFLKGILESPGMSQDQLTDKAKYDKATTARSVKKLEEHGYVKRMIDENDRRAYKLYPTQKAIDFEPILNNILIEVNQTLTKHLTAEEEQQLIYLLKKISVEHGE